MDVCRWVGLWSRGCTFSRYDAGITACWLIGTIGIHLVDPIIFPQKSLKISWVSNFMIWNQLIMIFLNSATWCCLNLHNYKLWWSLCLQNWMRGRTVTIDRLSVQRRCHTHTSFNTFKVSEQTTVSLWSVGRKGRARRKSAVCETKFTPSATTNMAGLNI